jgi:Amt family ammonium transporter
VVATAAAMLTWLIVEKIRDGHSTSLGAASGLVAGLVAITPASGYVTPVGAIWIGAIAGIVCALAVAIKFRFGFDDSLDVVAVHLIGGILGALSIGFFGQDAVNSFGRDGLFYGGGLGQLGRQFVGVGAVLAYSFVLTFIIAKVIDMIWGLRVSRDVELEGLDINLHAESAYDTGGSSSHVTTSIPQPSTSGTSEKVSS